VFNRARSLRGAGNSMREPLRRSVRRQDQVGLDRDDAARRNRGRPRIRDRARSRSGQVLLMYSNVAMI
jgi:hypothetical protein